MLGQREEKSLFFHILYINFRQICAYLMKKYREIKYFCNKFGASVFEGTFPEMFWGIKILICNEVDKMATYFHFCFQNDQINNSQINLCFEFVLAVPILKGATSVWICSKSRFLPKPVNSQDLLSIYHICVGSEHGIMEKPNLKGILRHPNNPNLCLRALSKEPMEIFSSLNLPGLDISCWKIQVRHNQKLFGEK